MSSDKVSKKKGLYRKEESKNSLTWNTEFDTHEKPEESVVI